MGAKGKLRLGPKGYVMFFCPGCDSYHGLNINDGGWKFNGDYDKPTFDPSILVKSGHYADNHDGGQCWCTFNEKYPNDPVSFKCGICHSFVRNGKIEYLSDCTHELAGQTVEMVDAIDF